MPYSEMFVTRKPDADRVAKAMRASGVKVDQLRERRGAHWLRFHGDTQAECQGLWKKAQAFYFAA